LQLFRGTREKNDDWQSSVFAKVGDGMTLISCNVCGETLDPFFPKVQDPVTNEIFSIVKCRRCSLGHTVPRPENLGRYYPTLYYGNRHNFTLQYCNKRRMGFVAAAVPERHGRHLLDIGCGDGSFLLAARADGWQVMGTELNPHEALVAGLDVKESIEKIPGSMQFNCITMWHTLEHMLDIPALLAHVRRLLAPQGRLIIAVPDFGGLQAGFFGSRWFHVDVPRHLYHFNRTALDYALTSSGFTIQKQWHQELEYDLLGWSQSALNYLMPYPNVFYNVLTGKRGMEGPIARLTGIALGLIMTVVSLPALLVGTLTHRGGTLIVVATR
jgi:SAM-dependent methyltransferase